MNDVTGKTDTIRCREILVGVIRRKYSGGKYTKFPPERVRCNLDDIIENLCTLG